MKPNEIILAARQRNSSLGIYAQPAKDPNPDFVTLAAHVLVHCLAGSRSPEVLIRTNRSTMTEVQWAVRILAGLDRSDHRLAITELMAAYLGLGFGYGEDLVRGYIEPGLLDLPDELARAEEMAVSKHRRYSLKHFRVRNDRVVSALPKLHKQGTHHTPTTRSSAR